MRLLRATALPLYSAVKQCLFTRLVSSGTIFSCLMMRKSLGFFGATGLVSRGALALEMVLGLDSRGGHPTLLDGPCSCLFQNMIWELRIRTREPRMLQRDPKLGIDSVAEGTCSS
jgi:hypothetical protein